MFKPLSTAYSDQITKFGYRSQGLCSPSKGDFLPLFYEAWQASFKEATIIKASEATGILPVNSEPILKKLEARQPTKPTQPTTATNRSLVLSKSTWNEVEDLIDKAIVNQRPEKLSQHIDFISTQNTFLEHEVESLKEALDYKKTRKKYNKALPLKVPKNHSSRAVCWSPRKVKKARNRQQIKALEDERLEEEKLERKRVREEKKLAKVVAAQEKAQARLEREREG
jgi:hypothetical protein